jgi:molecular chaperone HtpG
MHKETKQFQAEVKEILDLMVHSLYSNREIFLRELISNASDALDRLRFEEIENKSLATSDEEKHIRLVPDHKSKTLTIMDNGIGMTREELIQNIGTIAHSGTRKFLAMSKELKDRPELIGQFGVGFYSAFMVADKVTVVTQKAGADGATTWESTGDGSYTIEETTRPEGHGTTIALHLKSFDKEDESAQDFTEEWILRDIVKKYSDFIRFPIKMKVERSEPELDADGKPIEGKTIKKEKDEVLNSQKALWLKSQSEIKEEEYKEFYRQIAHDWTDPLETIHFQAEGVHEFSALLFIPSVKPYDYNQRGAKIGLSLYVKRVFIMAHCEELLPVYLRFVKGLVDSSDLPLNVSREILQKDQQIPKIKKALVGKILKHLKSMLDGNREKYEKFWEVFGATFKEGLASDYANKEKIENLCLFHSTLSDKLTTLDEYVKRMKSEQKAIYYITGESLSQITASPYLEKLKAKGFEVLLLVDPVDEFVMRSMTTYQEKPFVSITEEDLDLDTEEEKQKRQEEIKDKTARFEGLTKLMQDTLKDSVKEVRLSDRLVDSPVCLVSGKDDPSAYMERVMSAMGQKVPKSKRILEINPDHPVFEKMLATSEQKQRVWSEILYNQALLNEGSQIDDPSKLTKQIANLMIETSI